jgi:hypothetical protein
VPALTPSVVESIDDTSSRARIPEIAAYLRDQLGQRTTAFMVGAADAKQVAAYARGANLSEIRQRRLREGYKVVRLIETAYGTETAKAWLFGTNVRLDDRAPIEVLGAAKSTEDFADVVRAARQFATVEA